jgi:hypothetical protein
LKFPETQGWRRELLKNKWPHIDEEIALRKILTLKIFTQQIHVNVGTLAYKIKCKRENEVKKAELMLGKGKNETARRIGYK